METIYHVRKYGEKNTVAAMQQKCKSNKEVYRRTSQKKLNTELYEYFRFSYNFRFETAYPPVVETTDANDAVAQILHCGICPRDYKILTDIDGVQMDMEYKSIIGGESSSFLLPPSYCTSMLYRGLSIMFDDLRNKIIKTERPESEALDLFRKRLISLIYCTALASKLKFPSTGRQAIEPSQSTGTENLEEADGEDEYVEEEDNFDDEDYDEDDDEEDDGSDIEVEQPKPNVSNLRTYTVGAQNGSKFTISYSDTEQKLSTNIKRDRDQPNEQELTIEIKKCRYDSED